jgi:hypothetical protein
MTETKKAFTMRLSPAQRAFVDRMAARESRTASAWLGLLIDREIRAESETSPPPRKPRAKRSAT